MISEKKVVWPKPIIGKPSVANIKPETDSSEQIQFKK